MPKSLVTEDEMIFLKMLRKHKYLVIKTLYNKGGEGVVKVSDENEKKAIKEFNNIKKSILYLLLSKNFLMKWFMEIKRVILIDGKSCGIHKQGSPKKVNLKQICILVVRQKKTIKKRKKICMAIKKTLKRENYFRWYWI